MVISTKSSHSFTASRKEPSNLGFTSSAKVYRRNWHITEIDLWVCGPDQFSNMITKNKSENVATFSDLFFGSRSLFKLRAHLNSAHTWMIGIIVWIMT